MDKMRLLGWTLCIVGLVVGINPSSTARARTGVRSTAWTTPPSATPAQPVSSQSILSLMNPKGYTSTYPI